MKRELNILSRRYGAALRKYLSQGPQANLNLARSLGRKSVDLGLETLDIAKIHERALATLPQASRDGTLKRAEIFFAEAVTPIEKTHEAAQWVFTLAGAGVIAGGLLGLTKVLVGSMVFLAVGVLTLIVYSYLLWRDDPERISPASSLHAD